MINLSSSLLYLTLTLTILTSPCSADKLQVSLRPPSYDCIQGCYDALSLIAFTDITSKKPTMGDQCNSTMFVGSLAVSSERYCNSQEQEEGWMYIQDKCHKSKVKLDNQDKTSSLVNKENLIQVNTIKDKKKKFNGTVMINQYSFDMGYRTLMAEFNNDAYSHAFGFSIYIFVGIAVIIGLLNRLINLSVHYRHTKTSSPEEGASSAITYKSSVFSKVYTMWRKHVTMPALFGYRHSQPWGWVTIPTRLQTILIFSFIAINIIFMCVGYDLFDDNIEEPNDKQAQLLDYLQYRTGVMCVYNLPLLWMLAGRNDVILWITGWSFSSVNLWHRWIARLAVLQALIHGVAYSIMKKDSLTDRFLHRMYWTTGIFALVCFILLVALSIKPIRTKWYEIFLITHIGLALCSLVLLYFHLTHMKGKYNPYVWACVAVWCLDRFIRVCRVLILTHKALSKTGKNTTATIITPNDSGLIRLSIETSLKIVPKPGQYYFLYQPYSIKPWENHPFTLASWEIHSSSTTLHFLVAPQKGATKRWREIVLQREQNNNDRSEIKQDKLRLLLEGPYGHSNPIELYENVLLVAGGSGITSMLAYIHTLKHHLGDLRAIRTKKVTLVWVVKNRIYAQDVLNNELREFVKNSTLIQGISVQIQLYLTKQDNDSPRTLVESTFSSSSSTKSSESNSQDTPTSDSSPQTRAGSILSEKDHQLESPSNINEKEPQFKAESGSGLTIHYGRPSMKDLLRSSVDSLAGKERLAVSACGPAIMTDDMRKAVCKVYGSGLEDEENKVDGRTLEYFEELFCW